MYHNFASNDKLIFYCFAADYFQGCRVLSAWSDCTSMWSWFSSWWSIRLLQPLYRWCCFSVIQPFYLIFCRNSRWHGITVGFLEYHKDNCVADAVTGHAECVRFVKKFNLPLLVGFEEWSNYTFGCMWTLLNWRGLVIRLLEEVATQKKMSLGAGL